MNGKLRYLTILAILPLFSLALVTGLESADALKAQGSYGKYNRGDVCGVELCSDIPGGREAFEESQKNRLKNARSGAPAPVAGEQMTDDGHMTDEKMDEGHMTDEKHMKDGAHMKDGERMKDDGHMKGEKMDDGHKKMMMEKMEQVAGSVLNLARANVPATIPLHHGFYDGGDVYYIITDSSDETHAQIITESQGWQVELAPFLANAPEDALSTTYMFTNGIDGGGVHGFQGEVFTSTPAQTESYSALTAHVHVSWNEGATPSVLRSEQEIIDAESAGSVTLNALTVVLNMPHIVWPDGQMVVKEDKTLANDTPYGGGQVLDINTDDMTVTFVAHRGWGPDGRTIYYIVTDATPSGPANGMGVVDAPSSAGLIANSAAVDLFQFKNGIKGSGPLGFQPGIAAGAPGDANYSPMWRIFLVEWNDPHDAAVLETKGDIDAASADGLVTVGIARPMDADHIVNCPFIDPFQ